ncbi:MAG: hypothetical protein ACHQ52_09875, partial [Candidatus Eisenbacteria bacterium]
MIANLFLRARRRAATSASRDRAPARSAGRRLRTAIVILLAMIPGHAGAQTIKPWVPPQADSLLVWAAQAKARFMANRGDSTAGPNYRAYEIVGDMGRRLVGSLGRNGMSQAHAVETLLDSLGLDTDVRVDPKHPTFGILMVRNPYQLTAHAVGFLLWWKERDLREQAMEFVGGQDPQFRTWWTGHEEGPWEWGITDRTRDQDRVEFLLLQLVPSGNYWRILQYDPDGIPVEGTTSVVWTDVNGDEKPELLVFARTQADSIVIPCHECPRVYEQLTFVERPQGFMLMDTRVVPAPMTTFSRFVRLMADGNRADASRLLRDPRRIDEAAALGWIGLKTPGAWRVLYAEPNTAWPQWLMVRVKGAHHTHDYKMDFDTAYGRWVIGSWELRDDATTPG